MSNQTFLVTKVLSGSHKVKYQCWFMGENIAALSIRELVEMTQKRVKSFLKKKLNESISIAFAEPEHNLGVINCHYLGNKINSIMLLPLNQDERNEFWDLFKKIQM